MGITRQTEIVTFEHVQAALTEPEKQSHRRVGRVLQPGNDQLPLDQLFLGGDPHQKFRLRTKELNKASDSLFSNHRIQKGHDFWTLGVLLYECLFGVTPFQQENPEDTMSMILYANVAFPGQLSIPSNFAERNDSYLKNLKALISILLTKNKEFRDSLEIKKDLLKLPVFNST